MFGRCSTFFKRTGNLGRNENILSGRMNATRLRYVAGRSEVIPDALKFNSVLLVKTGSLTFLSRRSMLRTVRAFRSLPANFLQSGLLVPLIARLTDTVETEVSVLRPSLQSPAAVLDQAVDALTFVDVVLYVVSHSVRNMVRTAMRRYIIYEERITNHMTPGYYCLGKAGSQAFKDKPC
ncbi:uncharacterized protein HD556DRAFT_388836 [Suillus plorans]|uniref:Uncharacterized protein n=1 Tax=Suillus plorans TaxID=116603 RepID=A0A9P7ARJ4_9AGAM|nr:uncharacterized protein HD556DRAFT_388836 [Suillus plorans]KAG1795029.1 hypothetical protein HD556DRAFT_388836 [Suillus plorans]